MCLFQNDQGQQTSVGVCVCPVVGTTFSECSKTQWGTGQAQMAEFARPCLYMPTRRYATTTAWTVQFGEMGVVPCQSLDTVYCVKVDGLDRSSIYWMLGVTRSRTTGRRLFSLNNTSYEFDTSSLQSHNAMCADALAEPDILPHLNLECIAWCRESAKLLSRLDLTDPVDSISFRALNLCSKRLVWLCGRVSKTVGSICKLA